MSFMTSQLLRRSAAIAAAALLCACSVAPSLLAAQPEAAGAGHGHTPGGEVNIQLPDLAQGEFLGLNGHDILLSGLVVCVLGLLFGAWTYTSVKRLPVHSSMA